MAGRGDPPRGEFEMLGGLALLLNISSADGGREVSRTRGESWEVECGDAMSCMEWFTVVSIVCRELKDTSGPSSCSSRIPDRLALEFLRLVSDMEAKDASAPGGPSSSDRSKGSSTSDLRPDPTDSRLSSNAGTSAHSSCDWEGLLAFMGEGDPGSWSTTSSCSS